jgi:hypothetical protein
MGNGDLAAMERGEMDPSGYGMTKAGKIVGMVSVILSIVVIRALDRADRHRRRARRHGS